jgi:hypothetical protein
MPQEAQITGYMVRPLRETVTGRSASHCGLVWARWLLRTARHAGQRFGSWAKPFSA